MIVFFTKTGRTRLTAVQSIGSNGFKRMYSLRFTNLRKKKKGKVMQIDTGAPQFA